MRDVSIVREGNNLYFQMNFPFNFFYKKKKHKISQLIQCTKCCSVHCLNVTCLKGPVALNLIIIMCILILVARVKRYDDDDNDEKKV